MNDLGEQLNTLSAQLTGPEAPYELSDIEHAGRRYRVFRNAPPDLIALIEQGRGFGDKEFLVWQGRRWSYAEFYRQVDALAGVLQRDYALASGERVAIAMRNRPEWMVAFAAIILCGGVAVPLNSWGQREELVYGLGDSTPRLLLCDSPRLRHVADDLPALQLPALVVDDDPTDAATPLPAGCRRYQEVMARALEQSRPERAPVTLAPEAPAMIMYTSGTASQAKGVLSTHRAMTQGVVNLEYFGALFVMSSPERFGAMMAAGFEMTTLMAVPLFHSSGLHAQFLSALRTGRRIVIMYKWDVADVLATIAAERITQLSAAPAMMLQLLDDPRFDASDTRSLAWIGFGGAGLPERLIELVRQKKPLAMAGIGYGLTETNGPAHAATGEAFAWKPHSNGPGSPLFDVRILDADGQPLAAGEAGEIWLRSITLMDGYWHKEAATREVLQDGWLRTGDIGYLDDDGFLFVVDRIKDIVNRGGEKIASAEVESVLLQHPDILEAAAYGVPDDTYGEALAVSLCLRPGSALDADGVRAHVASLLAPYKVPAHVRLSEQPLPRNVVGKALKRQLQQSFVR